MKNNVGFSSCNKSGNIFIFKWFWHILQTFLSVILLSNYAYAKDYDNSMTDKPELVSDISENSDSNDQESDDNVGQYPKFNGEIDVKYKIDRIVDVNRSGIHPNEGLFNVDSNYSLNFSKNWSIRSTLTAYPVISGDNPNVNESEYIFRSRNRGFQLNNTALAVEELGVYFENQYGKIFAGKFDPKFGPSYEDSEINGVFSNEFRSDYDLVEEIGVGGAVNFNDNQLTISTFYDDNTELRRSVLAHRKISEVRDGDAANTSDLSSYIIHLEGKNLFSTENLSYHIGYRSLGVEKMPGFAKEIGYSTSLAYSFEWRDNLILVPFIELIKIDNFGGKRNYNDFNSIVALSAKYNQWRASILGSRRSAKQSSNNIKIHDNQLQFSVGYQFTDRLGLDVSAMDLKENHVSGLVLGAMVKYAYKF
jgi:hypothetical protein